MIDVNIGAVASLHFGPFSVPFVNSVNVCFHYNVVFFLTISV